MSGKNPRLSPLAQCKQLLIAESELNRTQLLGDISMLTADAQALTARIQSFGSLAGLAAMLTSFLHSQPPAVKAKPSWLQTLLKGAAWFPLIKWFWGHKSASGK